MKVHNAIWTNPITVILEINEKFHIGGGKETVEAILPIIKRDPYATSGENLVTVNIVSSFKGILNASMRLMLNSSKIVQRIANEETLQKLTGYQEPEELKEFISSERASNLPQRITKEGKLWFIFIPEESTIKELIKNSKIQISIDTMFGTAKQGGLYELEFVQHKEAKKIRFTFKLVPKLPLTVEECILLYAGFQGLKYSGFGGHITIGLGLIENIIVDSNFESFVLNNIRKGEQNR